MISYRSYRTHCSASALKLLLLDKETLLKMNIQNSTSGIQLGPCIRVLDLNVESISLAKSAVLSRLAAEKDIDAILLQETHAKDYQDLIKRCKIDGFKIADQIPHRNYGLVTLVRDDILQTRSTYKNALDDVEVLGLDVKGLNLVNVYKPPSRLWSDDPLPTFAEATSYVGDFNSHHHDWGYSHNDINGNKISDWIQLNNCRLVMNLKDRKTFRSAAHQSESNPDLVVFNNRDDEFTTVRREVLAGFPNSQHRPVLITFESRIPFIPSIQRPRWNFAKASWNLFALLLDEKVKRIPVDINNYKLFVDAVIASAKRAVPRGFRKQYIPGWDKCCEAIYRDFVRDGNRQLGSMLINRLDHNRNEIWKQKTDQLSFVHSSRQAWNVLSKLGDGNSKRLILISDVTANQVATRLLQNSKADVPRPWRKKVENDLKRVKRTLRPHPEYSKPFTMDELTCAISKIKLGKAAGIDGIYPEFVKYFGPAALLWILALFNAILSSGRLPAMFKKSIINAICKPGKDGKDPSHFRPVALLCVLYKLLERMILNRIQEAIENITPLDQAGYRQNRGCCEQMLAFATFVENGFQQNLKTCIAQLDLTAAFDTVWRHGLLLKFARVVPCLKLLNLLNNMLSNRMFQVVLGNQRSRWRKLNDGLIQGAVMSPPLWNLYTHDVPATRSKKFTLADDRTLAYQCKDFNEAEQVLEDDLGILGRYHLKWRMKPNPTKTVVSSFHLNNQQANRELQVTFDGVQLTHEHHPKVLGVILDRSLTYKTHLEAKAKKVSTRNNLLQNLAGTSWGARASTLRTAALSLVFPTAEYCCQMWLNSVHASKIDVQLHRTLRIISGCIKSTPLLWLHVLSNITPPALRRETALLNTVHKAEAHKSSLLYEVLQDTSLQRLQRKPPQAIVADLKEDNTNVKERWKQMWQSNQPINGRLVEDPSSCPAGMDLPRDTWTKLNRIRTNHGRCAASLARWGMLADPSCDCGYAEQTIHHVVTDCPNRKFSGTLEEIHECSDLALSWIQSLDLDL